MWLGSDLIGVVLPSETPSVKPNKNSVVCGIILMWGWISEETVICFDEEFNLFGFKSIWALHEPLISSFLLSMSFVVR